MGTTRFNETGDHEQRIVDTLYKIFTIVNNKDSDSDRIKNFESIIKLKPNIKKEKNVYNLKIELDNIIQSLNYLDHTQISLNINVYDIFTVLEEIMQKTNLSDFGKEIFDSFNTIINKMIINFIKNNTLEKAEDKENIILKYGELIALLHRIVITKIENSYATILEKLEKNEEEDTSINNKIFKLETVSKNQTKAINQVISVIKTLKKGKNQK